MPSSMSSSTFLGASVVVHVAEFLHEVRIPVIPNAVAVHGDAIAGVLHVQHELGGA